MRSRKRRSHSAFIASWVLSRNRMLKFSLIDHTPRKAFVDNLALTGNNAL
ncbi:hypothetical protein QJS04_geneDACA020786 [Acorus gramineus]|uniref:Uncharacterized protein n=1 Tax=Acorus gramineus TaxID=55184 RepID=A0AAV9A6E1_ACOGR|nr:hypothetical protein QJS04_geneDACA020786 [Acorus gramineus]